MGMNKKYINGETIKSILDTEGIMYLVDFILKSDCLITMDEYASKVCDLIKNNNDGELMEFLSK